MAQCCSIQSMHARSKRISSRGRPGHACASIDLARSASRRAGLFVCQYRSADRASPLSQGSRLASERAPIWRDPVGWFRAAPRVGRADRETSRHPAYCLIYCIAALHRRSSRRGAPSSSGERKDALRECAGCMAPSGAHRDRKSSVHVHARPYWPHHRCGAC